MSENAKKQFASSGVRNQSCYETHHCPATIGALLNHIRSQHPVVLIVHYGFFGKHILLPKLISCYSHYSFVKNCYIII